MSDDQQRKEYYVSWFKFEFNECKEKGMSIEEIRLKMHENAIAQIGRSMSEGAHWKETKHDIKEILRLLDVILNHWMKDENMNRESESLTCQRITININANR